MLSGTLSKYQLRYDETGSAGSVGRLDVDRRYSKL